MSVWSVEFWRPSCGPGASVGSNPDGSQKFLFFEKKIFFYIFFHLVLICIELSIPWGMFTNFMDPLGGREAFVSSLMWDIAHCAIFTSWSWVIGKWSAITKLCQNHKFLDKNCKNSKIIPQFLWFFLKIFFFLHNFTK